jgi:preprotein translocase subunit SecD
MIHDFALEGHRHSISVVFGVLFTFPTSSRRRRWTAMPGWLPKQKLNLGLDLQGGSYLLLRSTPTLCTASA